MKIHRIILALLLAAFFSGCGGGGSSITGGGTVSASSTVISGAAANGLIKDGTVKIYLLADNGSKVLLAETKTDSNGRYTSTVTSQSKPVLIEVTGGTYIDEATGSSVPLSTPLHALVSSVTGATLPIAVTPLTELAYLLAGSNLTASNISRVNTEVTDLFNVDIIATQPVEPTLQSFQGATSPQRDYTLALAGISQQAKDTAGATIASVLESYRSEIARDGRISSSTANTFKTEVSLFLAGTRNQTGTTDIQTTGLANVGTLSLPIKLSTTGIFAAGSFIKGINLMIKLPTGVTVRTDSSGIPLTGVVVPSGSAASNSTADSSFNATTGMLTIGIINAKPGFPLGEFITITCDIAPGAAANVSSFPVSGVTVSDSNGQNIDGITIEVSL